MDPFILWTALVLGLRHSLDFDHLAAIADISGAQSTRKSSFWGCAGYALGHAGIVLLLGGAALLLGLHIPAAFGAVMEKVVGVTLLILAGAIIISALKYRDQGKVISRWRIIYSIANRLLSGWKREPQSDDPDKSKDDLSFSGCLVIGVLHGVGVESPTQILALGSAMTLGNPVLGLGLVALFAFGMIVSNMAVALLAIYGFQSARQRQIVFLVLSLISAVFSAIIGVMLLLS
jgi:high-affinity nickel-transport protein